MLSTSLTNLTPMQVGSFGGVSPTASPTLWNQPLSENVTASPVSFRVEWTFNGTTIALAHEHMEPLRLICHFLVSHLSADALPELLETLGDMREFYAAVNKSSPQLQPSGIPLTATTGQSEIQVIPPVSEVE